jgi:hypothetical protein
MMVSTDAEVSTAADALSEVQMRGIAVIPLVGLVWASRSGYPGEGKSAKSMVFCKESRADHNNKQRSTRKTLFNNLQPVALILRSLHSARSSCSEKVSRAVEIGVADQMIK